ncbi:hypothetical protein DFH08DRAFT_956499 [Mycena albidolilacea]|uniref:AB hydrolase-1 domain-containing protein n=1 Tax=Mycena albidolilacea TaxID=1033008 RepID=A0AAD7AAF7_9AGAR|nr:hypothetical protein DFH08DRAFT_956499 [Mycena albidolilacea]
MTLKTLPVDANGTVLAFTDGGKPDSDTYITIFAVHGMVIFKRVAAKAASKISVLSLSIGCSEGSTPHSEAEGLIPITGSDEDKAGFIASRGVQLGNFIDAIHPEKRSTPMFADIKTGGMAVLGWLAGDLLSCAVVVNIDSLSPTAKDRFKLYLRPISCKITSSRVHWSPHMTPTIPADKHPAMFTSWITSYSDHGDLSTRDVSVLSYHVPSPLRWPTIYNMTADEIAETADQRPVELPGVFVSMAQANATYRKACYSADVKALVPSLKTTFFTGDRSASYSLAALWSIEDDNKAGGGNLKFVVVPGANHFLHWDDADEALKVYVDVL